MALVIKRLLEEKGLSQRRTSRLSGIDLASLNRVVNGKQVPYRDWGRRLARLVGVPEDRADSLFVEEGQEA